MRFDTLPDWLAWQETLHPKAIDLGLERVREVAKRMGLGRPAPLVVTVGGTNGKGSSVALLESILAAAGYRVGAYTSPHLLRYNERVRIDGHEAADGALCDAFACIDAARGDISLSYFEFGTLAALHLFAAAHLDAALLEVGLGGRLDAVNIVDADAALVTGVDIDHVEWLGPDRESIGREKGGIFRTGRPAVCSDPQPPGSLRAAADACGAVWFGLGEDYGYHREPDGWHWWGPDAALAGLPAPALPGEHQFANGAGVLMVLDTLRDRLPVPRPALETGLRAVRLAGRFQVVAGAVERIFDVAHNPHGARALAAALAARPCSGRTLAVCAMLADKDAAAVGAALAGQIDAWYLGGLEGPRALAAADLARRLALPEGTMMGLDDTVMQAWCRALQAARPGDRVVVFGSFLTVAMLLPEAL